MQYITCKICGNKAYKAFDATILKQFDEAFYKCKHCGFLSCNEAHWLELAYHHALNLSDTGLVMRNLYFYKIVTCIAALCFGFAKGGDLSYTDRRTLTGGGGVKAPTQNLADTAQSPSIPTDILSTNSPKNTLHTPLSNTAFSTPLLLDFGGGSGLLVRLLRDVGIEAFWNDAYCENIFARGFEWEELKIQATPSLATCFEVFEHLPNPREQIDSMLALCPNLLFSTELLPCEIPQSSGENPWWYYGFTHGQHISFYTYKTLELIAKDHNLHFCSCGSLHLFSQRKISPLIFKWIIRLAHRGLFRLIACRFSSKTMSDSRLFS